MRVLLQHTATGEFIVSDNKRTTDPDLALLFDDGSAAVRYACRKKLKGVQVVLKFGDPRYDLQLPVEPQQNRTAGS